MAWQNNYDKLFIGGEWTAPASDSVISVISPYTEQRVASVPAGNPADMDRAVGAARAAFDSGPWPRMSLDERIEVLRKLSIAMIEHQEYIATLVTTEMGCPITLSRTMQSGNPRLLLDSFLGMARSYPWSTVRRSDTGKALVTREPVGVVAAVVPWNAPVLTAVIKAVPALLAGCSVVLKPSPEAPLSAYLLAEMLNAAGLPPGTLNVVPADREASEYLVSHPGVDKVSFTGSTAAGKRIASLCGNDLRRVTLELGGKSAAVVLGDADLDQVVESIRATSLRNSGQTCSNKTRIVAERSVEAELLERLVELVRGMPMGDPEEPATQIGPMVSAAHRSRVENYIEIGRQEGAKVLVGGTGRPRDLPSGWFVRPTIFSAVDPTMRIAQEEIFGPVLTVSSFTDDQEAVAIANNSVFGLSGSVFSRDLDRALAVARRIRTGTVELNGRPAGWHAPAGGFKASGLGREGGPEGFDAYVELKSYGLPDDLADSLTETTV